MTNQNREEELKKEVMDIRKWLEENDKMSSTEDEAREVRENELYLLQKEAELKGIQQEKARIKKIIDDLTKNEIGTIGYWKKIDVEEIKSKISGEK